MPSAAEGSAVSESLSSTSQPASGAVGGFSSQLLESIRERFYFPKEVATFLDSASGSLKLKAAIETLAESSRWPNSSFGADAILSSEVVSRGADDVRRFLGGATAVVIPALSATHAVYRTLNAVLGQASGSNLVTTNLEHPAVGDSTYTLAKVYGKERRVAGVDPTTGRVPPESVLRLVDRGTDALAFVHGSNITGAIIDVEALVSEARRLNPNIFIIVDGVQYASHHWVGFDDLGIDAYVFSPYKIFSVKGLGFTALSDRLAQLPHWSLRGYETTDWTLGNPDDSAYAAWSSVVAYLDWLGSQVSSSNASPERIAAAMAASGHHTSSLLDLLVHGSFGVQGLKAIEGVRLHAMADGTQNRLGIALFEVDGIGAEAAAEVYLRQGIAVSSRTRDAYTKDVLEGLGVQEGIRVSTCHYTTPDEIEQFLRVTASIAAKARRETRRS